MNHRENLLALFRRQGYEFAPVQFDLCPSLLEQYRQRYGDDRSYEERFGFPWRGVCGPRIIREEPVNWAKYYEEQGEPVRPGGWIDDWGIGHEKGSEAAKHMTRMRHPMMHFEDIEQFEAYPYQDFSKANTSHIAAEVDAIHANGLTATGYLACTVWEIAWYLRGMEQLMMDMLGDEELAAYHFDRVTEQACIRSAAFAKGGVDHIHLGDDIGMQHSIMMSEGLYREWIKPRLKRVIDAARKEKPDVVISYHSCGFVTPFIPDLIEVGVEVLNPVQPECMDFAELHAEFGDRLSFWGTLGTQKIMPFGKPEDVRKEVVRNLETAGSRGGLLCTPTHLLEPEVPWENIEAYMAACKEFSGAGA